ncbi:sugar phosphate nucleotidyltransferase [Paracoccus benzoatiresistens]|uniref:Sugar phosphate nucleotidyltransferase n=1 Tax=Paracoccus benzoatiresistens TaxID=2997341 RepID=A0ABT4J2U1_9RHOB|nr:sugar phosphate nucleotidyltransferase [Paracoccus sp. EF6]MCZ0961209.1 sugar phosphate nucleotidyltransferase [Paracoccus sp. EF6]
MTEQPHVSRLACPDHRVATILLAGGKGTRLHDLTVAESKPAVPFAGRNRIVDFAMANVIRSGLDRLVVATQFAPATLHHHLPACWGRHFAGGAMVLRDGRDRYLGTADAVRHNWQQIEDWQVDHVLVVAADHIYDMDYGALIAAHRASGAAVTVAVDVVPLAQASGFGVMHADANGRILSFLEKPAIPPAIPGEPDRAMVSMGIYVFDAGWLKDALFGRGIEALDFGHEVIPAAVAQDVAMAYRLPAGRSGRPYWRDVGTLEALRQSHMDFAAAQPARLPRISPTSEWYLARGSVMMPGAVVPPSARLTCTIVAPGTRIPQGLVVGEDPDEDARWFRCEGRTVLVTQAMLDRREAMRVPAILSAGSGAALHPRDVA